MAHEHEYLKAVGLITVNRNEIITIRIFEEWDEEEEQPGGLVVWSRESCNRTAFARSEGGLSNSAEVTRLEQGKNNVRLKKL